MQEGLTQECVDVNAAGDLIVNNVFISCGIKYLWSKIYVTYSPLLNKSHFVTATVRGEEMEFSVI